MGTKLGLVADSIQTMSLEMSTALFVSFCLLELSTSAVVLPRPPSSPNHIDQRYKISDYKYNGKAWRGQNTNVEKPNTDNYKLLEFELRGENVNTQRFRNILREVFGPKSVVEESKSARSKAQLKYGKKRLATTIGYHSSDLKRFEKKVADLRGSRNDQPVEKLYYLKHGKTNVLPTVGGVGGKSSRRESTSLDSKGYLKPVPSTLVPDGSDKRFATKSFRPKKYRPEFTVSTTSQGTTYEEVSNADRMIFNDNNPNENNYEMTRSAETIQTTENPWVTSSELPKQIPAPPSRIPPQIFIAQTTPVQKYAPQRSDSSSAATF